VPHTPIPKYARQDLRREADRLLGTLKRYATQSKVAYLAQGTLELLTAYEELLAEGPLWRDSVTPAELFKDVEDLLFSPGSYDTPAQREATAATIVIEILKKLNHDRPVPEVPHDQKEEDYLAPETVTLPKHINCREREGPHEQG
jgi:hypothetical protein